MKLVSINIEQSKHLDRVAAFLMQQKPDILCLQEVMQGDLEHLSEVFGSELIWHPMLRLQDGRKLGLATGAHDASFKVIDTHYYLGDPSKPLPDPKIMPDGHMHPNSYNRLLLKSEIVIGGQPVAIFNTHATWTHNGESTPLQIESFERMLQGINTAEPTILVGDFNAPRSGASWQLITNQLTDHIPGHYKTSLDPELHRAPAPQRDALLVDGFFTSEHLSATNVQLHTGVSDHQAVSGKIHFK